MDGAEYSECDKSERKSHFETALENLKAHFIKNKLTYNCLEGAAKLMNSTPGAIVQLPTTKYLLLKAFTSSDPLIRVYYIYCQKCKKHIKCSPSETTWTCINLKNNSECGQKLDLIARNYFIYIKLEQQLKRILEKYWIEIVNFNQIIQSDECDEIRDTYSGTLMQNVLNKRIDLLSLMINSDGICLTKSGSSSVWPLQIICNFLPPKLRYRNENILCVAFYCENIKLDALQFCEPFAEEIEQLQSRGFLFQDQVFRVAVTCGVFDLPAKGTFQQLNRYNGYFACGYCLQKGEWTTRGVRYTWNNRDQPRTHEHFIQSMQLVSTTNNSSKNGVKGVKGISPAISFEFFDMVKSFGLDYMHCVCLGIMRNLPEFWLESSKKHKSYIRPELQKTLNKRLQSIKPCKFLTRLPRSLKDIHKFKASEFRSLMLFYFPVILKGILKDVYYKHFLLLSGSIYKLLQTNISLEDVEYAENNLKQFVKSYGDLYGITSMTMNVHLLTHIPFCVKNLGPLWTQSMYSFESNNATFSRYVHGYEDVLSQLCTKYIIHKSIPGKATSTRKIIKEIKIRKKICLSVSEVRALSSCLNMSWDQNKLFETFCVYNKNGTRFTSINYSKAKRTIDYVVELENKIVGKVKFYFKFDDKTYAFIEQYRRSDSVQHIHEIVPTNILSVFPAEVIEKKFIYINFPNKHYITNRPNEFESD